MDQALFSPKDFLLINSLSRHNKEMKVENHHLSGPRSFVFTLPVRVKRDVHEMRLNGPSFLQW